MNRPDSRYLDLRLLLGADPATLREEVLGFLLSPPALVDLTSRRNELLTLARNGDPKFVFPKKAEELEACSAVVRDAISRLVPGVLDDVPAFRKAEKLYKDRELRMGTLALTLLEIPLETPDPEAGFPKEQDLGNILHDLYRVKTTKETLAMFALVFCPKDELDYSEWKSFLTTLRRRFPAEAELYACCFSSKFGLDYILYKLKGKLELKNLDQMLESATALSYHRFMEAEMGSGPEGALAEGGGEWLSRFFAGTDRLLKKKLVDMQTKEIKPAVAIELETDGDSPDAAAHGGGSDNVINVGDLDGELGDDFGTPIPVEGED